MPPHGDFSAAILDVNLDGQEIFPVADILKERGLPFVFVTGYGERSLPEPYRDRPALQKPFQADQLEAALSGLLAGRVIFSPLVPAKAGTMREKSRVRGCSPGFPLARE